MVIVKVKLLDSNQERSFVGEEPKAEEFLRDLFPRETENAYSIMDCVQAVNAEGFAEVDIQPFRASPESNLLPVDYDKDVHREDPWPREGDED